MSNHPTIAALKAALESERTKEKHKHHTARAYRLGHEAATERLMPLLEKAVETITTLGEKHPDCFCMDREAISKEFLTTLADASGKLKKPGHYIINAESFDKIIDDLDKEPSEQVKKAREKFLQLKKEAPDENK